MSRRRTSTNEKVKLGLSFLIGAVFFLVTLFGNELEQGFGMQMIYALVGGAIGFGFTYFIIDRFIRR